MAGTDVVHRTTSLTVLRVVAAIGSVLALGLVVTAFSSGWLIGAIALATAPVVPLVLVVLVDRVLSG